MGLKESECGQIGVTMMAGTDGWIMDAPAATAYAVLPGNGGGISMVEL